MLKTHVTDTEALLYGVKRGTAMTAGRDSEETLADVTVEEAMFPQLRRRRPLNFCFASLRHASFSFTVVLPPASHMQFSTLPVDAREYVAGSRGTSAICSSLTRERTATYI
jgi:hypothetical protein